MRMHRFLLLGVLLLLPAVASAARPHFQGTPTVTVTNNRITVCGTIAGLGNADVTINLTADGTLQCINRGGSPPPGQRVTASGSVSNLEPKNGSLNFCVTTAAISNPCPDRMSFTVTFANTSLAIVQNGRTVLSGSFRP